MAVASSIQEVYHSLDGVLSRPCVGVSRIYGGEHHRFDSVISCALFVRGTYERVCDNDSTHAPV